MITYTKMPQAGGNAESDMFIYVKGTSSNVGLPAFTTFYQQLLTGLTVAR